MTDALHRSSNALIKAPEKAFGWSRRPPLWIVTLSVCAAAGFWAARMELGAKAADDATAGTTERKPVAESPLDSAPAPPGRSDGNAAGPGSWMTVPASWMDHCRLSVQSQKLHELLKLDPEEALLLTDAADMALDEAKELQAEEFEDRPMKEGDTLHLPGLPDRDIRSLVAEVVAVLPANLSAAEKELVGFLMERRLRAEYGRDLEITLEFSGGMTSWDLNHVPRHLLGFNYVVRPQGSPESDHPVHYSVVGNSRFDFLKLHPSVDNRGRDPLAK